MQHPNAPKVGDIQNGRVFTEAGTGLRPARPKKHTLRNVILVIVGLSILGIAACTAMLAGGANEVAKSIETNANKPGGDANPLTITPGNAFEVDGFNYATGLEDPRQRHRHGRGHRPQGHQQPRRPRTRRSSTSSSGRAPRCSPT